VASVDTPLLRADVSVSTTPPVVHPRVVTPEQANPVPSQVVTPGDSGESGPAGLRGDEHGE
jgi:hypothetical protein